MIKGILFSLILSAIGAVSAQKMSCEELKLYRDVTLLSILDRETAKAKQQYDVLVNAKKNAENQIKALQTAKSNSEVQMAMTALKGAYEQATSILSAFKAAKGAVKIAVNVATVAESINKGKGTLDVLLADNEKAALVTAIENEVIGAIPVVSNVYNLYKTVVDLKTLNTKRNGLIAEVSKANANLDKVCNKLSSVMSGVKRVNDYQYYISDYLNKYCGSKKK